MERIGITGHQLLGKRLKDQGGRHSEASAWVWVEKSFLKFLSSLPGKEIVASSSLAAGADQRLSRVAFDFGASLEVIIPAADYIDNFTDSKDLREYKFLLSQAVNVISLSFSKSSEAAYLAAGKLVADRVDTVVAVWDGLEAAGMGGTGDIAEYARKLGKDVLHINPISRTVYRSPAKE